MLDEIDRLLDGGFEGEIDAVMKPPGTCQTLCFGDDIVGVIEIFRSKLVPGYAEVLATDAEDQRRRTLEHLVRDKGGR